MSSPVHSALCVARDGATVDIELAPTTATSAHFPFSRFFGLWLLHEAASTIIIDKGGQPLWRSSQKPGGTIAREVSDDEFFALTGAELPDELLLHPPSPAERQALRERKRGLVERFVTAVSYSNVKNWRPMLCEAREGRYFEPLSRGAARPHEAFQALQNALESAIEYDENEEVQVDEDALPKATLRVEATDERWTEHLAPGMGWDVYVFDDDAGELL
jgi:hypothetical protein